MTTHIRPHVSEVLKGNAAGDPHERDLWVYTPPGYDSGDRDSGDRDSGDRDSGDRESGDQRYPLLVCLIGFTGTGEMVCTGNRWSPGLPARLDRLIAEGMPPVIVAFPDCFTRWGGSQYVNSSAIGRYEDYVCDEIIPFVEQEYRCTGNRGVFGKSSGGYGAVRLPMQRPGLFSVAASHSGDMGFAFVYQPEFADALARLAEFDSLDAWLENFHAHEKKASADFGVMGYLAMASCYSPDPAEPYGFALPAEPETGELIPEVWERWRANDPVNMAEACADGLRALDLLFLDCGTKDEWRIHLGLRAFTKRLDALRIPYESEEFPDTHRELSYRYDVSLPKLAAKLAALPDRS